MLRITAGFVFSVLVGHLVLWLLIEKTLWPYVRRHHAIDSKQDKARLSWLVGIMERGLYTAALMVPGSGIQLIAGFLALKVTARWHS